MQSPLFLVRSISAASFLCFSFCTLDAAEIRPSAQKIAFVRDGFIWVANIDGTAARKVIGGGEPALSPDATHIVFQTTGSTSEKEARGAEPPETHLAVVDLASHKVAPLKEIPAGTASSAVWSPDGKQIVFVLKKPDAFFDLDLIGADGASFKVLKKGETQTEQAYAAPCWVRDGQSIFCHNTHTIYRLGLDGAVLARWELKKILPEEMMTSSSQIDVSPDANRLLLTCDYRATSSSPPTSLWLFELTKSAARLPVPKELSVWWGCWLDNNNILIQTGNDDRPTSIYRMSLDGRNLKCLIKNGIMPSVTPPN